MASYKSLSSCLLLLNLIAYTGCASRVAVHQDTKPEVISTIRPVYPFEMRRQDITGNVVVEFTIDVNGDPINCVIRESTNPSFNEPAITAIRQWKFKPGTLNGRPIAARVQQSLIFDLRKVPDPKAIKIPKA